MKEEDEQIYDTYRTLEQEQLRLKLNLKRRTKKFNLCMRMGLYETAKIHYEMAWVLQDDWELEKTAMLESINATDDGTYE